jgi:hypothetical protein
VEPRNFAHSGAKSLKLGEPWTLARRSDRRTKTRGFKFDRHRPGTRVIDLPGNT